MDEIVHRVMRFDRFVLDLTRGCVRSGDQTIELRPKTFEVLRHLVANAGRVVSKEELFEAVWPNVVVGDNSLVQCIRELRQKLGDDEHRLVKTVSRRGYVLDAAPRPPERGEETPPNLAAPVRDHFRLRFRKGLQTFAANLAVLPQRMRGMRWRTVAAAAGILVCAGAAAIYLFSPASVPVKRAQPVGKEAMIPCPPVVVAPFGGFDGWSQIQVGANSVRAFVAPNGLLTCQYGLGRNPEPIFGIQRPCPNGQRCRAQGHGFLVTP